MDKHSFTFKKKTYELTDKWDVTDHYQFDNIEQAKDFQMEQFNYLSKIGDFTTMENRIINLEKFGFLKQN